MTAKTARPAASTPSKRRAALRARRGSPAEADAVAIRPVRRGDLEPIVALDAQVTGVEKREYWRSVYRRYGQASAERQFLVAEAYGEVVGFGTGARLLAAVCAGFRRAGVRTVRTLLHRDNTLVLSFFRSQGMMAGPFIPLEMDLR
jgi:hypothetical protein